MPPKARPVTERFWEKVRVGADEDCWLWVGTANASGYGVFHYDGRYHLAHRIAWMLTYGSFPEPCGLHKCDVPACCNPNHLFEGTQADNMRDAMTKGRATGRRPTHCPKGHPYEGDNLYVMPNGGRMCRECHRNTNRQFARAKKAKQNA
jgi:hypothetical protein